MNEFQIRALIIGITGSSNTAKQKLGRRFAEKLGLEPNYHKINISIMLARTGYKETFKQRLFGHSDITSINIHLLTLRDIFEQNDAFQLAKKDLPKLAGLEDVKIVEP